MNSRTVVSKRALGHASGRRRLARLVLVALGLLAGLPPDRAHAQTPVACSSLQNPVYLQVGDTQEPLMKELGRALRDADAPITLVYLTSGSCPNVTAIYTDVKITKNMLYVPSTAESASWDRSMPSLPCTVDPAGQSVELANAALFVSSCTKDPTPSGIKLFQGPVQGYGFVVPKLSTQVAITAEEAYFAFGFADATGMVQPWTNDAFKFVRTATKSTLLTLASVIRVPAPKFKGIPFDSSSQVQSAVLASPMPEQTIGLLGVELFDQAKTRQTLNLLAFQAYGQRYAYYPDSTSRSFDKRNLRDGHYVPWSPTVWLTKVDGSSKPINANAGYVIDLILANAVTPKPKFEPLDLTIGVGLVPDCAMKVTRTFEAGDLSLYQPAEPCGCYFEKKATGTAPASCVSCNDQTPCASGTCRHGYCEAR